MEALNLANSGGQGPSRWKSILLGGCALTLLVGWSTASMAQTAPMQMPMNHSMAGMGAAPTSSADDRQALLDRIQALESRLAAIEARTSGAGGAIEVQAAVGQPPSDKTSEFEQRLSSLETNAVLSEPKQIVKRLPVWIDKDGNQFDHEVPGSHQSFTYQRETTSRRQSINEEIEEALADADSKRVAIGVNTAFTLQQAFQTLGARTPANRNAYGLASADLLFTAPLAQNTVFFADVVGLSGNPPDNEINPLTLLNSYTARLSRQNELNLREAWVRTELLNQQLAVSLGRLDLTNFFDRNAAANDETSQFLSDSLVNNPTLGLSSNGPGVAAVYQPYSSLSVRLGVQQSDPLATSLSKSLFVLGEVGYLLRPFGLPEGNYRIWVRTDNSSGRRRNAVGVSLDQKLTPVITAFGRYGTGDVGLSYMQFYSAGLSFARGAVFNPLDTWGVGYSHTQFVQRSEDIGELFYNLHVTDRLRVSPHLQYVRENQGVDTRAFVLPGLRLQASF